MAEPKNLKELFDSGYAKNPALADLMFFANPSTGLGGVNTIQAILSSLAVGAQAPVRNYPTIPDLLANTDIPIMYMAFVVDASADVGSGWALYLYQGGPRNDLGSYTLIIYENFTGGGFVLNPSGSLSRTMDNNNKIEQFTGSNDAVWTFPPVYGNFGTIKIVKNKTVFDLTLQGDGSGQIFDFEQTDSRVVGSFESRMYVCDENHWTQI